MLNSEIALSKIHEIAILPDNYYLGVDENNLLNVNIYRTNKKMPNNFGILIKEYLLPSYDHQDLIKFALEIRNYIALEENK